MRALESYRGQEFIGVEELTSAAASLIELYGVEPARGNVRLSLTPRIVRHYLSEDLLGEPTGQAGTSLIFNYGNLLRLLAVKRLLAEHWSVVKIKEFMTALDIMALEQLVSGALASSTSTAGGRSPQRPTGRESASVPHAALRRPTDFTATNQPPPATSFLAPQPPPPLASLAVESARRAERAATEWIELTTGLEIKVRRSFRPPRTEQERERLAARFWSVINRNAKKQ
jgi:DNA-binding transcriptional MerR regulator